MLGLETGLATSSAVGGAKVTLVSTPKMGNIEQLTNARNGRGEGGGSARTDFLIAFLKVKNTS